MRYAGVSLYQTWAYVYSFNFVLLLLSHNLTKGSPAKSQKLNESSYLRLALNSVRLPAQMTVVIHNRSDIYNMKVELSRLS